MSHLCPDVDLKALTQPDCPLVCEQIFAIAGSLTTFGSPANLVMNVGTGVKDFFYEPINGLVQSPKVRPHY
jgi:hypothetical protein